MDFLNSSSYQQLLHLIAGHYLKTTLNNDDIKNQSKIQANATPELQHRICRSSNPSHQTKCETTRSRSKFETGGKTTTATGTSVGATAPRGPIADSARGERPPKLDGRRTFPGGAQAPRARAARCSGGLGAAPEFSRKFAATERGLLRIPFSPPN